MFDGQYLLYSEYKLLGGTLDEAPFNILEYNARKKIDERTFGRLIGIDPIPSEVKLCVYKLIDVLNIYDEIVGKGNISSESTDGYSISYSKVDKSLIEGKDRASEEMINTYLCNTYVGGIPVLYRGVK